MAFLAATASSSKLRQKDSNATYTKLSMPEVACIRLSERFGKHMLSGEAYCSFGVAKGYLPNSVVTVRIFYLVFKQYWQVIGTLSVIIKCQTHRGYSLCWMPDMPKRQWSTLVSTLFVVPKDFGLYAVSTLLPQQRHMQIQPLQSHSNIYIP